MYPTKTMPKDAQLLCVFIRAMVTPRQKLLKTSFNTFANPRMGVIENNVSTGIGA